jgi:hypothetical protein
MKNFVIIATALLSQLSLLGQSNLQRDLFVEASFTPATITQNQSTTCGVVIYNNDFATGTGPKDTLYSGSVWVQIAWTARTNALNTPPGGNWGSKFTWTYLAPGGSPVHGGWYGVNNQNIVQGAGFIQFFSSGKNTGVNTTGANINVGMIAPFGEGEPSDNFIQPLITVTTPAPVELSGFDAFSKDCGSVVLNWNTASELNNAYFEVLRSSDGKEFLSLGRVEGSNASQGSRYEFTDASFLISGNKYLYRLKQVDFDGKATFHDIIAHSHYCEGETSSFTIYPNPAFDRVNMVFSGPFNDEVTLMLSGNDGSLIRKMSIAPENGNLDVSDLPAGIYQVKVLNGTEEHLVKFIKID